MPYTRFLEDPHRNQGNVIQKNRDAGSFYESISRQSAAEKDGETGNHL